MLRGVDAAEKEVKEASRRCHTAAAAQTTPTETGDGRMLASRNLLREHHGKQRAERPDLPPQPFPTDGRLRRGQQLVLAKEAQQKQESAVADDHERYGGDVRSPAATALYVAAARAAVRRTAPARPRAPPAASMPATLDLDLHPKTIGCRQCKIVSY